MKNEIWKPVVGYENFYWVSNLGRIKRNSIYHKTKIHNILKPIKDNLGYLRVDLSKNNRKLTKRIHRIVMLAFIGDRKGYQINHKDFNKENNFLENLEYVTAKQNTNHAIKMKGGLWGLTKKRF